MNHARKGIPRRSHSGAIGGSDDVMALGSGREVVAPPARIVDASQTMDERIRDRTAASRLSAIPDTGPFTAGEAAALLGVDERTVRRAIARGALPATKRGGAYRIAPVDLARYEALRRSAFPVQTPI